VKITADTNVLVRALADGAIAFEGSWLGAEMFVSFDKQAVELLKAQGQSARLLS
jgi:predicted nucleic-acid-binding protein